MAQTVADWGTWKKEVDAYIADEQETLPAGSYTEIFDVQQTSDLVMTETTWSGLQPMVEVSEMGNAVEDENQEGFTTKYARRIFRKKVVFSKVLWDTDRTDTIKKQARGLPYTARYSRQLNVWSDFRRAWDPSRLHGDGKTLVSLSHPRKDGGPVQANTFLDGLQRPLNYDNALLLQDVMLSVVSNSGNLMSVSAEGRNKTIIVPPTLREKAFQIAGVDGTDYVPDSAERNANYFRKGDRFDVLVVDFLKYEAARQAGEVTGAKSSSANFYDSMWGIVDTAMAKDYFKVYEGAGYPSFANEINRNNESLNYFGYDHYTFGNTAWYPVALSKGDGSTFSL